jgi:hypothetical protein
LAAHSRAVSLPKSVTSVMASFKPSSQIIWMANLTGRTELAETYSRILQKRFG